MSNLFSIFEPKSWASFSLLWVSSLVYVFIFLPNFWAMKSFPASTFSLLSNFISKELKPLISESGHLSTLILSGPILVIIMMNNSLGLVPYVFTSSSHLVFTVALAAPLWVGHILYFWMHHPTSALAHLVPLGTPVPLMPFMVLIELISNLIRPLTLSVRLAANMVAGHLLISLLSSACNLTLSLMLVMAALSLLMVLEVAVALIQSYVFSVLMTLYLDEAH